MLVLLKRTWIGPNGARFRANKGGTLVPDDMKASLPKSAKILDESGGGAPRASRAGPRAGRSDVPADVDASMPVDTTLAGLKADKPALTEGPPKTLGEAEKEPNIDPGEASPENPKALSELTKKK